MQPMQSSYGTDSGLDGANSRQSNAGKFAALRHVTRQMNLRGTTLTGANRAGDAPGSKAAACVNLEVAEGAGLAHDAGNLLGALSLYSDLLALPGVLHEEHREYAAELRMLSDRSWAMIDRLVNHARGGRRPNVTSDASVLPDVVDRCRGLLCRIAGRTVEVSYGLGAFQAIGVPLESLERILTNLIKNAAEATPWVGAISIHVEGRTERSVGEGEELRRLVVMTVRDRGCGMDAMAVRCLMQEGGISPANGRGLGFRVVRELVAMSGGCLKVESQPEVGTSISAEWYALSAEEARVRMGDGMGRHSGVKMVIEGEAGWIAC